MVFSKSFPKTTDKSVYPKWEEVVLTPQEEEEQERLARADNIKKLNESVEDAKTIMRQNDMKPFQTDLVNMAIALFEKRASHEIYYKENKAKEKFDSLTS